MRDQPTSVCSGCLSAGPPASPGWCGEGSVGSPIAAVRTAHLPTLQQYAHRRWLVVDGGICPPRGRSWSMQ
jgi:hypothetical protein